MMAVLKDKHRNLKSVKLNVTNLTHTLKEIIGQISQIIVPKSVQIG